MNYPLIYVDEATTIKEGICLMKNRYVRRLPLKKTGKVIGIVTLKRIIGNIPSQGMDLAVRREVKPYCLQKFEDKEKTSKHIDDAHLLNC